MVISVICYCAATHSSLLKLKVITTVFPSSYQVSLAWGIKLGTPVLPKAVSENHIKENLEALHVQLDEDDMKTIENIGIRHRYFKLNWMFKPEEVPKDFWDGED